MKTQVKNAGQRGRPVPMKFIEPGLVAYADVGTVLLKKETLDKFVQTFVGCPVFNESHKPTSEGDFSEGKADGIITSVEYRPDGWYWFNTMIWDDGIAENAARGYGVSCAYDVMRWSDSGGIHNNIPYEREILDGRGDHVAVVSNPRYEDATLFINSLGGDMNPILKFFSKGKEDKAAEIKLENAVVILGEGDSKKEVPVQALMEAFNASEAAKKAAAAAPAKVENATLTEDDEVEIENVGKVKVKNMVAAYNEKMKNDADEAAKKAKEKEDADRKNADDAAAKEKADKEAKENALKNAADDKAAKALEDAAKIRANGGVTSDPVFLSRREMAAKGAERYGKMPGAQTAPAAK